MKILRIFGYCLGAIAAMLTVATLIALWVYQDIPAATLEAKYAGPTSQFIELDGVRIHYRDEGEGPGVLLLHANFSNLIGWDPWVEALQDAYRVVRMDFTSHGLTGPDPSGDYSQERTLALVEKFVDAMDLGRFSIAGTSMGGTMAIKYTHKYPQRIDSLILLSPGSLEGKRQKAGPRSEVPDYAYLLTYIMPRALPAFMLRSGFGDPTKLTEEQIDQWYELWMREGQRKAQLDRLQQYEAGDIEQVLRELERPVLLLWGEANTTAEFEQAAEFRHLMGNVESLKFISYPGVGHMAVQEDGATSGRDVRAYLDQRRAD